MADDVAEFEVGGTYLDGAQAYTVLAVHQAAGTVDVRFQDGAACNGRDAALLWRVWLNVQRERAAKQRRAALEAARERGDGPAVNAGVGERREDHGSPTRKSYTPEYLKRIRASLRRFVLNGDDVVCVGFFLRRGGTCEMCSKVGLTWHYVLANLNGEHTMVVGSECVTNYTMILSQWGYRPDHVAFPEFLWRKSYWIRCQGGVAYHDGMVMQYRGDARPLVPPDAEDFLVLTREGGRAVVIDRRGHVTDPAAYGRSWLSLPE